jgi:ligand-binding SRPBCC domain-containing protein
MALVELVTRISAPRSRCFDLSRSVDVHVQSTAGTGEKAIAGRTSGLLSLGEEVTWRARHFGVSMSLGSRITAYNRPEYFQDSMVHGPLASLVHDHHFADDGDGGTVMRDVFRFSAPLALLGRLAEATFLTRHFRRLLEERNAVIKWIAESQAWTQFVPTDLATLQREGAG